MTFQDPKHPIWTVASGATVVAALGLMLVFNYNSVDRRDIGTLLVTAATYLVTNLVRGAAVNRALKQEVEPCEQS